MRVSLVIPVRNERATLPSLIQSIDSQSRLPDEVIIVDGGSTDGTVDYLNRRVGSDPRYIVVSVPMAYPGTGRNIGTSRSTGDVIAFTDGGIVLDREWLKELTRPFENPSVDVVYGSFEPETQARLQKAGTLVYVPPLDKSTVPPSRTLFVASMALRRSVFEKTQGFPDTRATEDRVFMEQLSTLGVVVARAPRANLTWQIPSTSGEITRRFRVLARHGLRAGREKDWHVRVWFYWAVGISLLPLLPLGYAFRVIKNMRKRGASWATVANPLQFGLCGWVTILTDIGLFAGTWDFLVHDRLQRDGLSVDEGLRKKL